MRLKRREFLQRASLALGALRINEAGWWRLQSHYSEALAQTTGGKLAFLVGINEYVDCLLYTSPSPRDATLSRMPSSA